MSGRETGGTPSRAGLSAIGLSDVASPGAEEFAPAKINLYLHVTGRRADGYHLLDSLTVFADIGDRLAVAAAAELSLAVTGPFAGGLTAEADNLVLRAARALAVEAGVTSRGRLVLRKNLPIASGIGGGSADAAAALRLLCRTWSIDPGVERLAAIGAALGADVPVCLRCTPARMQGIGEVLTAVPELPPFGLVLVNPGVAVATASVFKARHGEFSPPAVLPPGWRDAGDLAGWLHGTCNDLQPPALALAPAIGGALAALSGDPDCLLARMSGSGATCFGVYASAEAAAGAAARLSRPGWWVWGGSVYAPKGAAAAEAVGPGA
ncbi:4-(cytidine 5'-diphospho)-2-C-methyl-D-erythritol kinase [Rhodopila sp.]|jgi:4-diphosphocytidyl-2-C-methyl-D-erythritol kinase|uniref:4-(cytidine 5'-diphospho)-2-C-methyl-D-erythritol kinase n=1 Tax=Rhodopila sp. TaxID=2480087 RepID=UPI002C44916F|nr:4-(cytidine 5'-diphospho)-2-C-methyl-D-erythritol kinase [Rhodopila sp.]HVZ09195.1 4-(cytidine 5'-diphospho)-2-C-methyl-D-erythritol kinase [Rhodopila sp.]